MSAARGLVLAVSWLSLGNFLSKALAIVTMPLLTRWLSPAAYGEAALALTVVSLLSVFALAGIDMSYSRHYFSGLVASGQQIEAFSWRWAIGNSLLFGVFGGALWFAGLAHWLGAESSLAGFVVMGIIASALATLAQTRARLQGRYAQISLVQFSTGLAGAAISLTVAYFWRQDAWPLLLAMLAGYGLPILLLGMAPIAQLSRPSGLSRGQARKVLGVGLAGVVTAPAYWVLSSSDRWFLAASFGSDEVGVYSIGYTVGTVGMIVSMAITSAWLPELSRNEANVEAVSAKRKAELSQLLIASMLVVWLAVVAAGGDTILLLADIRFHQAVAVVPWLATGVLCYGVMHVGNTHLILLGRLHWAAWCWALVLMISLALNYLLVPRYGALGAAITQAAGFCLIMVLVWAAVLRHEPLPLHWARIAATTILVLAAGFAMFSPWARSPLLSLAYKAPAGLIFAVFCLQLLSPALLRRAIAKVVG